MANIKLGELLVKANVLQESQLKSALAEQARWGGKIGEILVRMNLITEDILVRALSKQLSIPAVNLEAVQGIPPHVRSKLPLETARDLTTLPLQLRDEGKTLLVAMAEPQNIGQLDTLRAITKCRIVVQLAGRTAIARAFARFYEGDADVSDMEGSFKVMDAQGKTMIKAAPTAEKKVPLPPPVAAPPPARGPISMSEVPMARAAPRSGQSPSEVLKGVEDVQRKEVAAIKAMVELLIDKGVFTRDEYLAKVKR
ncbi:MAG: GspE/PulE/PilB domain-containing protein [Myxococcaceae bacterium]